MYDLENTTGNSAFVVFVNTTSQDAVVDFGAYIQEAYLKSLTGNQNLRLKITNQPFPRTLLEQGINGASAGTSVSILFAIAFMLIADSLIQNIIREREKNIKHQIMVSGGGKVAYWASHYIGDLIWQAPPSIIAVIAIQIFGVNLPQSYVLFIAFILAHPVCIYFLSFLFATDVSGSFAIRILYLVVGIILPIAVTVMFFIESTQEVAKVLRWFGYLFPVFSLNFGISQIADLSLLNQVQKLGNKPNYKPLS